MPATEIFDCAEFGKLAVTVFAARRGDSGPLRCLVLSRLPEGQPLRLDMDEAVDQFRELAPRCASTIYEEMGSQAFDVIVTAPSGKAFARLLSDELARLAPLDIGDRFDKDRGVLAGDTCTAPSAIYNSISYSPRGDEHTFQRILIVDDVIADGKTIRALLRRLLENGVRPDARFYVACAHRRQSDPVTSQPIMPE